MIPQKAKVPEQQVTLLGDSFIKTMSVLIDPLL